MRVDTLAAVRLPTLSVRIMTAVLEEEGIDATRAYKAAGLAWVPGFTLDERISAGQELAFQRAFAGMTRHRPELWLKTGFQYKLLSYGSYGLSILTSSSFRDAVETAIRDDLSYSLAHYRPISSQGAFVGFACDLSEVPGNLRDFTVCRDAAAIFAAFQDLWDRRFPFTRIELALPAALDPRLFAAFGCEVVLGCDHTAFHWDPEVNRRALPHGNPMLKEHYTRLWQRHMPRPGVADRLFARILHELGSTRGAQVTLSRTARRLGLSERTLQRRLSERGLSFSDVLAEARKVKAMALLGSDTLDVSEIAWRLGYADVSSFNHAFRRWTGVSPNRYRADLRSGIAPDPAEPPPDGLKLTAV